MINVLCIEDDLAVANYISSLLDRKKYSVNNITDGKKALDFLLSTCVQPDIILLDYILPSLDGLQILKELKAHKKDYAIVFLTVDETLETAITAMKEGAMDYLTKSTYLKTELNIKVEKAYQIHQERLNRKYFEDRFRSIFEMANAGIFFADQNGQIIIANTAFQGMVEYSSEELANMDFSQLTHPDDSSQENELIKELIFNEIKQYRIEKRYVSKNGKIIWADLAVTVILDDDNKPSSYVGVINNISERKKNEQQMKEIISAKDKFFSIISHDLRNQFASLRGLTDILMDKENKLSELDKDKFISLLHLNGKIALALLEDLLKWSRSQINKLELNPEKINLHGMLIEVGLVVQNQATLKQVKIVSTIDQNHEIVADKQMISTVLRNLVNNAIKFTRPEGKIVISAKTENNYNIISVKDNGVGMTEDVAQKIFRIDTKHSTLGTEKEMGTGLGLILCKEFIDKHGGEIKVESEIGVGSEFIISLPIGH